MKLNKSSLTFKYHILLLLLSLLLITCKKTEQSLDSRRNYLSYTGDNSSIKEIINQLSTIDSAKFLMRTSIKEDSILWGASFFTGKIGLKKPIMQFVAPFLDHKKNVKGYLKLEINELGKINKIELMEENQFQNKSDSEKASEIVFYKKFASYGLKINKSRISVPQQYLLKSKDSSIKLPDEKAANVLSRSCTTRMEIQIVVNSWSCGVLQFRAYLNDIGYYLTQQLISNGFGVQSNSDFLILYYSDTIQDPGQTYTESLINDILNNYQPSSSSNYQFCNNGYPINHYILSYASTCSNPDLPVSNEAQLSEDLADVLAENSASLIDCDLAKAFKPLATFVGPAQMFDRIANLNNNVAQPTLFSNSYFVHQIQNAAGYQINLDRFEINVNTLPIVNQTQLTASAFLKYIRLNINAFINTNIATFQPYTDPSNNINDTNKWNSANPVGSILHLNMDDDGSVILGENSTDHWTVSTIRTPIDGAHPVSGNRKWGYEQNPNGTYTFYVTGVDRLTTARHEIAQYIFGIPFSGADDLWTSFQSKLSAFVNSHSGNASVGNTIKERPDYQKLRDYFNGNITLTQLKAIKGCK